MNIVRELRKSAGMQQKELAALVGVSIATVSDWETQKKNPSGERLKRLSEIFNCNPLVILGVMQPTNDDADIAAPKTPEARLVSFGMDQLPQAEREKILSVLRIMYMNNPKLFREETSNDDT